MSIITARSIIAKRIRERTLPSVSPPITQDDEVRRNLEGINEHLRMYEGDSNNPTQRFVTIEELMAAGAIGTTIQQGFAAITTFNGLPVPKVQDSNPHGARQTSGIAVLSSEEQEFRDLLNTVTELSPFFLRSNTADTAEGQITFEVDPYIVGNFANIGAIRLDDTSGETEISIRFGHSLDDQYFGLDANSDFAMGITPSLGSVFWHDDNDGPGSLLDADTVDGSEASVFMWFTGPSGQIPDLADLENVQEVGLANEDLLQYNSGTSSYENQSTQTVLGNSASLYFMLDVKGIHTYATGDLLAVNSDAPNLWDVLTVGADDLVLVADAAAAMGMKWAAAPVTAPLDLADNEELRLGTGQDALIDFDGTNSIWNQVAGDFIVQRAGTAVFQTQQFNATGNTTGAQVLDHGSVLRDVGMNDLNSFNFNASDTLEARHAGAITGKTGTGVFTLTGPTSSDVDFGVGKVATVCNLGATVDYTISDTATCTMFWCDGTAAPVDIGGSGTLEPGGFVSLWRQATGAIYIFGSGFTP